MAEIKWGTKRTCTECETRFYDMQRTPITCPKCGAVHRPVPLLKSDGRPPRKNRARPPAPLQAEAPQAPSEATPDEEPDDTLLPESEDAEADEPVEDEADDTAVEPDEFAR